MSVLARKMIVQQLKAWAVLFLVVRLSQAEVTVENGAYRNLLVSFSPAIPTNDGAATLDSMKSLLQSTSNVLYSALGVWIGEVTFLLPDSWDVSGWDPSLELEELSASPDHSDVVVENVLDSAFGKTPFAVQFGGCGVPGSRITVPFEFLNRTEEYPKGKLLAREWLKYRYGVFDENGFPGDPLYPTHYMVPGDDEVKVTECTDPQVEYVFKDSENNNCSLTKDSVDTCKIHPGEMNNATSSLMFFHEELPNLEHVCDKEHAHNNLSPSKQNVLCGERAIWGVLRESSDFKTTVTPIEEHPSVAFHYVKERKPRVVVVFETTALLSNRKDELTFALNRLVTDLPEGSHLGLIHFSSAVFTEELRPLSELTDRENVVPPFDFDTPEANVCPLCAIDKAVEAFPSNSKIGSIILIAGSNSTRVDNTELVKNLKDSELCLKVIALRDAEATVDGYSDFLSQLNCQSLVEISNSEEKPAAFEALYQAMMSAVPQTFTNASTAVVTSGAINQKSPIEIPADPMAEKFTIWFEKTVTQNQLICKTDDESNPPKISKLGTKNTAYTFDAIEKDVTCTLSFEKPSPVLTQVLMTTRPGEFFAESVWIHDPTPVGSEAQMPVILYAKLNYGDYPVSNARVTARVTDPNGTVSESIELYDNGKGDPDITKDDGIYSRYFFQFTMEGEYQVTVEMTDDGLEANVLKKGADMCCGSEVKAEKRDTAPKFSRTTETSFHVVSARPEEGYPPSKIIDLRVEQYQPPTLLELKWTAPGGEVDTGKAKSYILKSFTDRKDALENFNSSGVFLSTTPSPGHFGGVESLSIVLDEHLSDNATHHLAMRAVSESGLEGDVSNVVTVVVPLDTRTTGDDGVSTTPKPIEKSGGPSKTTIGIVIGVLVGVLVISVVVYAVFYCVGRRKAKAKEATDRAKKAENGNNTPAPISLNSIPAEAIVRHHNEVVLAKNEHRDPPIFKEENLENAPERQPENSSPKYSQVQKPKPELPEKDPPKRMTFV